MNDARKLWRRTTARQRSRLRSVYFSWLLPLFLAEAFICGLNKHISCPGTGFTAVTIIPSLSRPRSFHQVQGQAVINTVLNTVADNGEHVPIEGDVSQVGDPSMAGNDH